MATSYALVHKLNDEELLIAVSDNTTKLSSIGNEYAEARRQDGLPVGQINWRKATLEEIEQDRGT